MNDADPRAAAHDGPTPNPEGFLRRARHDGWEIFQRPWSWVAQLGISTVAAVAGAVLGGVAGAVVGVLAGPVIVLVISFTWALTRSPFLQRDEARAQAEALHRELHPPEFPRHRLVVRPMAYIDVRQREPPQDERPVVLVQIDFTNRTDEPMQLEFELQFSRRVANQELGPYALLPYRGLGAGEAFLPVAFLLEPAGRKQGDLAFDGQMAFGLDFEPNGFEVTTKQFWHVALRVTDHITGATVEADVPARGSSASPTPRA